MFEKDKLHTSLARVSVARGKQARVCMCVSVCFPTNAQQQQRRRHHRTPSSSLFIARVCVIQFRAFYVTLPHNYTPTLREYNICEESPDRPVNRFFCSHRAATLLDDVSYSNTARVKKHRARARACETETYIYACV